MRNPLSWRNVNTTVTSNPNLALRIFQDSNNNLLGTFKDIYDKRREANTIDAMEKIRAGEPIGTDYGGVVDRKALLDFLIKQEQFKRQKRLDNARLNRLSQVMSLAAEEENRKKQTFPISLEAARLQNKKAKIENNNLQDTYNLTKKLTKSRIDLNEAKAIKAQRTNSLEDIKTKIAKSDYDNQTEIENLRDEYVATQQAISNALKDNNYSEVKRLTDEANLLKQEIGAKSGFTKGLEPTKSEITNLYNIGYNAYDNSYKDVPLTDEEKLAIASKSKKVLNKSDFLKKQIENLSDTTFINKAAKNQVINEIKNNKDKYYRNYLLDEINKGHIKIPETKSIQYTPKLEDLIKQNGLNPYDSTLKGIISKGLNDRRSVLINKDIKELKKRLKAIKKKNKKQAQISTFIKKHYNDFNAPNAEYLKVLLIKSGILQ